MTKGEMLKELTKMDFSLIDLGIYLNTHPFDTKALAIYNDIACKAKCLRDEYNEEYGPLSTGCPNSSNTQWVWINDPWPWEECFNENL